jgi:hypothetical protein
MAIYMHGLELHGLMLGTLKDLLDCLAQRDEMALMGFLDFLAQRDEMALMDYRDCLEQPGEMALMDFLEQPGEMEQTVHLFL